MKINCFIILSLVLLMACSNPQARKPIGKKGTSALQKTVKLNKSLLELENKDIYKYIALDTLHEYFNSNKGFWYAYVSKKENSKKPVKGDIVEFEQEIKNLNNEVLYSKEELGIQTYVVDKEHLIKGVQEGIKIMRKGEEVLFLFSSFVAYRTTGDANKKIGINEPIITQIKLTSIK